MQACANHFQIGLQEPADEKSSRLFPIFFFVIFLDCYSKEVA